MVVHKDPYWIALDHDPRALTSEFVKGFDAEYYRTLAESLLRHVFQRGDQRAAMALRTLYGLGQETLFALLAAILQTPELVPAWLNRYQSRQLYMIVAKVARGDHVLNAHGIDSPSWADLSRLVHRTVAGDAGASLSDNFGDFWKRMARDLLEEDGRREYGSIKHGHRVRPGGFRMSVGKSGTGGQPCPPEEMTEIGRSDYGSKYHVLDKISGHAFRLAEEHRNWNPTALTLRLHLVSCSLRNLLTFLDARYGEANSNAAIYEPAPSSFERAWISNVGATCVRDRTVIPLPGDEIPSTAEIVDYYQRSNKATDERQS
ncbi:MAG: hypothetical protein ACF8PN_17535 [Phycisphaerales bacterium]